VQVSATGIVTVTGGWRAPNGAWLRRATFSFRPTPTGVVITMPVRAGDQISYSVFVRDPQITGPAVSDGGVRTALSLPGTGSEDPELHASASDRKLTRVTLTAIAAAAHTADISISG
jgi:hypothetical protein